MVNWNRRGLLEAALGSLTAGGAGVEFEVVVVDNGSSDGSVEAVRRFAAEAAFPVRLIENSENRGFCAANNQGIAAAGGEFIALLNNDAEADAGFLAELRAGFREPDVGMAAAKIVVWEDPEVIDKVGHLIYPDGQNRGRGTGQRDVGQYDEVEEILWPDGCACMYRRSMLDEIGGFDEDLFAYGDDAELGLRARAAGWRALYMPRARVRHHRGATLGQQNPRRVTLIERNRVLLAVKLFPGRLLWLNGVYLLARLAAGAVAALTNRGEISRFEGPWNKLRALGAFLRGDLEALLMLAKTIRKRRQMRRLQKLSPGELRSLILRYRISLGELSGRVASPRR